MSVFFCFPYGSVYIINVPDYEAFYVAATVLKNSPQTDYEDLFTEKCMFF